MAFTLENLSIATNSIKAGVKPSFWTYYNEDNDAVSRLMPARGLSRLRNRPAIGTRPSLAGRRPQ